MTGSDADSHGPAAVSSADVDSSGTYFISVEAFEARPNALEQALLESLRELLRAPALAWDEPPRPRGRGAESVVLDLSLRNAGEWSHKPLVVRLLHTFNPEQLAREAAFQSALADSGFPAPRPVAHGSGRPGTLQPFLVMERVPGRVMFSLLPALVLGCIALALAGLGALAWVLAIGWYGVAVRLQSRLHAIPVAAIEDGISAYGLGPAEFGAAAWVERLGRQVEQLELHGFASGVAWLRSNFPAVTTAVACHGDFWAGNMLVSLRGVTGLIDWPNAAIAPREFDLAWNLVQDGGDLPPADRLAEPWRSRLSAILHPLVWTALLPHRWLYRLFNPLDSAALDYYTAFHCLRILTWSVESERSANRGANPWNSRRARALIAGRFERITGVELEMPEPPEKEREQ